MRSGVAVVADSWYRAKTALDLMPIEWDYRGNDQFSYAAMDTEARELLGQEAQHAEEVRGDPRPMLAEGATGRRRRLCAALRVHCADGDAGRRGRHQARPGGCLEHDAERLRRVAAGGRTIGRGPVARSTFTGRYVGGAFGYGNQPNAPRQAAEIAKQVGRPVKVIWSREEDQRQSRTRPPIWARFQAVLGDDGLPTAVLSRAVGEFQNPDYADRDDRQHALQHPELPV